MIESPTLGENPIVEELLKNMVPFIKLQRMISQISTTSFDCYESILVFIKESNLIGESRDQMYEFLSVLSNSAKSHSKSLDLIKYLLKTFNNEISNNFTSDEIFSLFSSNKSLLLYLYEIGCINIDTLQRKYHSSSFQFPFFYPEFKSHFDILSPSQKDQIQLIEKEINEKYENGIDTFLNFRNEGHSEMTIAKYIRDDDIEKFTVFVSPENFDLNMKIPLSIFESNSLLQSEPTLIEYACFFGSIKIFKFLWLNEVEIDKRIFQFTIAGKNLEIIHIIENKCKVDNNEEQKKDKKGRKRFRNINNNLLEIDNDVLIAAIEFQQPEVFEYFIEKYNFLSLSNIMIPKIIEKHNFMMFQHILQYISKESPNCSISIASTFDTKKEIFSIDQILKMKDNSNKNFLHFACIYGNIKVVNFLCNYKLLNENENDENDKKNDGFIIDVNEKDKSNWTPLHYACKYDYLEIVKTLVNCYGNLLDFNVEDDDF